MIKNSLRLSRQPQNLFAGFLLFLPFTQALTINLFFPLKISEILLALIVLVNLARLKIRRVNISYYKKETALPLLFALLATLSCFINLDWKYPYALCAVPFRISYSLDSIMRLLYVYGNFCAFYISIKYISANISILRFWLYGAVIAAFYSWYLVSFSMLHLPAFFLPGMEEFPQTVGGIIRCGTFKEGNFLGPYLLVSSALAFHFGKKPMGWFLLASVLTSFSTLAIPLGCVFVVYLIFKMLSRRNSFILSVVPLSLFLITIFFIKDTDFYKQNIYKKLFVPLNTLTLENYSKVDRYLSARTAFMVGVNNPFIGVGPSNYGQHCAHYCTPGAVLDNPPNNLPFCQCTPDFRPQPNSVYFEVFAEYGFFGLFLFLLILLRCYFVAKKQKLSFLTVGLLLCFTSIIAFPSFIMLFLWVYFAIPFAIQRNSRLNPNTDDHKEAH